MINDHTRLIVATIGQNRNDTEMAEFGSPVGSKPVSPPVPVNVGGVMPKGGAIVVVLGGDMVVGGVVLEGGLPPVDEDAGK